MRLTQNLIFNKPWFCNVISSLAHIHTAVADTHFQNDAPLFRAAQRLPINHNGLRSIVQSSACSVHADCTDASDIADSLGGL